MLTDDDSLQSFLMLPPSRIPAPLATCTCKRARACGQDPRFVDKLPVNYLRLPLILAALPNARIVHLVRAHGRLFRSFKQLFADAYLHSYEQREMARHHIRYRQLMDHYRQEFPGRFIDVSYEDVARDLDLMPELWLGHWASIGKTLASISTKAMRVRTASAVQVREPAHTRSIGRWQQYETQLAPMSETLAQAGISLD